MMKLFSNLLRRQYNNNEVDIDLHYVWVTFNLVIKDNRTFGYNILKNTYILFYHTTKP